MVYFFLPDALRLTIALGDFHRCGAFLSVAVAFYGRPRLKYNL